MNNFPKLFDASVRRRHHERSIAQGGGAWFVQDNAADSVHERLTEVNRTFTKVAIIGFRASEWAISLGFPDAEILEPNETLRFSGEDQFDLIIHGFALHWANDPVGQLVQMRRALRKDGLMMAVFLGGDTLIELRQSLAYGEAKISGGISPRVSPMIELRDAGGLLQRAGYGLPVADKETLNVEYGSMLALMQDIRNMGETNALFERRKSFLRRDILGAAAEFYNNEFGSEDRIKASFDILFLTGWSPDESQQKPLRPGSAQNRLADALGVPELDPNKETS